MAMTTLIDDIRHEMRILKRDFNTTAHSITLTEAYLERLRLELALPPRKVVAEICGLRVVVAQGPSLCSYVIR